MGTLADRWGSGLLIAAVVSATALCLPALRGQPLAIDEHVSYFCSGAPTLSELGKRCDEAAVLPPLSHLPERAALALGGRSESVFRLPSLIAYLLSVPAAWWLGRLAGGSFCGGLTALIVAWHPGMLDEVRFARCYGLVLLLSTVSTGLLLRWNRHASLPSLAGWSLAAAALCWTHYLAAPLVAAQGIALLILSFQNPPARRHQALCLACLAIAAASLACLPLVPAVLRLADWGAYIEFQRFPATVSQAFGAAWTIPALLAVLIAFSRRRVQTSMSPGIQRPGQSASAWLPLFLWLLPLAVVAALAILDKPMLASARYRVVTVPASALAVALALSQAFRPLAAFTLTLALLVITTVLHGTHPCRAGRLENAIEQEWKQVGLELAPDLADPGVLVFVQTGLAEGVLLPMLPDQPRLRTYVACRLGGFYTGSERALPIPLLWDFNGPLWNDYRKLLRNPRIHRVRIVGATDTDLNALSTQGFAEFVQSARFHRIAAEARPGLTLLTFETTSAPTAAAVPEK